MLLDHVSRSCYSIGTVLINPPQQSDPLDDRIHFQSVNLIDRSTLVYNNVSGPHLRRASEVPGALLRHHPCRCHVPGPCNGPWDTFNVTDPALERSWYLFHVTNPAPERSWYPFHLTNPAPERSWYLFNVANPARNDPELTGETT